MCRVFFKLEIKMEGDIMQENKAKEAKFQKGESLINISKIYESLRYNDYSIENGIGEIIDNSIEAGASRINVFIEKKLQGSGKKSTETIDKIVVVDNGCGMNAAVLSQCLTLGVSIREKRNGKTGIGRFGVGMTLGAISLARKIEVYSRNDETKEFLYTFIELDMISRKEMEDIPDPMEQEPPAKYGELLVGETGTIVVLSECDRLDGTGKKNNVSEATAKIANYLGRTYRKFIVGGTNIILDGKRVYLHDPLYVMGPTQFDTKESQDPKAEIISRTKFDWDIPGTDGEKATVTITLSLLPKEWRLNIGDGGKPEAKKRKIDQNEGISILRADREVLYDKVPYLIGAKGQASYEESDRWWGCEISFPPELDECFQIRYIKRGAEPIGALKDKLKEHMTDAINSLRKRIKSERAQKSAEKNKASGSYKKVEKVMADISATLPVSVKGKDVSSRQEEMKLEEILDSLLLETSDAGQEEKVREDKKEELKKKPYSIEMVRYPQTILFEPEYLMEKVILKINVNHLFYQKVIQPLCGDLTEDSDEIVNEKSKMKDAIMLMLLSYVKAEAMFRDNAVLFENLRTNWGTVLSAAIREMEE